MMMVVLVSIPVSIAITAASAEVAGVRPWRPRERGRFRGRWRFSSDAVGAHSVAHATAATVEALQSHTHENVVRVKWSGRNRVSKAPASSRAKQQLLNVSLSVSGWKINFGSQSSVSPTCQQTCRPPTVPYCEGNSSCRISLCFAFPSLCLEVYQLSYERKKPKPTYFPSVYGRLVGWPSTISPVYIL